MFGGLFGGGKIDTSGAWSGHMKDLFNDTILPSVNNAIGSGQQIFDQAGQNAGMFNQIFNMAPGMANFNPTNINAGFGSVNYGPDGIGLNLSPELQRLSSLLGGQANQFFGGMVDPMQAAGDRFAQMESILQPYRQRDQERLDQTLFSRGQLGSSGGAVQQQAFMDAVNQQRNQNLLSAIQSAEQSNMLNQQMGNSALSGMMGLQQSPMSLINPSLQYSQLQQQGGMAGLQTMLNALAGQQSAFGLMSILPELQMQPARFAQSHQGLQNQLTTLNAQVNDSGGPFGSLLGGLVGGMAGPIGSALGSKIGAGIFGGGGSTAASSGGGAFSLTNPFQGAGLNLSMFGGT